MSNPKRLIQSIVKLLNDRNVSNEEAYDALVFLVCMYGLEVHDRDPKEVYDNIVWMVAKQHVASLGEQLESRVIEN